MKYAYFNGGVARDVVSVDPFTIFNPAYASGFEAVPDEVGYGWIKTDSGFVPPREVRQGVTISPVEFKLLFTSAERISIKEIRATDPVIDDYFDIVEDPRLQVVDLGLHSVQEGIRYLQTIGILTEDRVSQILAGTIL